MTIYANRNDHFIILKQWCFKLPGRSFDTWWQYFTRVIMVGVLVGSSICLQNISFLFVTVALYTMVGATVPIFQLCWALSPCFALEKPSRGLFASIAMVVAGLVLIGYGSTEVNPIGLVILLCSVTVGGLNQVIVQSQLQRDGAKYLKDKSLSSKGKEIKLNPIVFTWEIAPWASIAALCFTLAFDLEPMMASPFLASTETFLPIVLGLCGSGTFVCIDVLFQRLIVQNSSAVNLSIISTIKELLTVFAGILLFGDEVTPIQFCGMGVAVVGVKMYSSQRRREMKVKAPQRALASRSRRPRHRLAARGLVLGLRIRFGLRFGGCI